MELDFQGDFQHEGRSTQNNNLSQLENNNLSQLNVLSNDITLSYVLCRKVCYFREKYLIH